MNIHRILDLMKLLGCSQFVFRGDQVLCTCPLSPWTHHSGTDAHPSFSVKATKHGGAYYCFSCHEKGHIKKLPWEIMRHTKKPLPKALLLVYEEDMEGAEPIPVNELKYRVGGPVIGKAEHKDHIEYRVQGMMPGMGRPRTSKPYVPPPESFLERFSRSLPRYITRRISRASCEAWGLLNDERDRRVIFPVRDRQGKLIGTTGRTYWDGDYCFMCGEIIAHYTVDEDGKTVRKVDHQCSKCGKYYVKYRHMSGQWRRTVLYGAHLYEHEKPVVLVEGTVDAIRLWDFGVRSPMATLGTKVSDEQFDLLQEIAGERLVVVMGDGDDAGYTMNKEVVAELTARKMRVHEVKLEYDKDPGKLSKDEVFKLLPEACFGLTNGRRVDNTDGVKTSVSEGDQGLQ